MWLNSWWTLGLPPDRKSPHQISNQQRLHVDKTPIYKCNSNWPLNVCSQLACPGPVSWRSSWWSYSLSREVYSSVDLLAPALFGWTVLHPNALTAVCLGILQDSMCGKLISTLGFETVLSEKEWLIHFWVLGNYPFPTNRAVRMI